MATIIPTYSTTRMRRSVVRRMRRMGRVLPVWIDGIPEYCIVLYCIVLCVCQDADNRNGSGSSGDMGKFIAWSRVEYRGEVKAGRTGETGRTRNERRDSRREKGEKGRLAMWRGSESDLRAI